MTIIKFYLEAKVPNISEKIFVDILGFKIVLIIIKKTRLSMCFKNSISKKIIFP